MPKIDTVFHEIGFGKIFVILQDGRIVSIPEQEVEQPEKIKDIVKVTKIKKAIEIDQ